MRADTAPHAAAALPPRPRHQTTQLTLTPLPPLPLSSLFPFPPADFSSIKARCESRYYTSVRAWVADASLVTDNARAYNRPDTDYYQCANKVDIFIASKLRTATWATAGAGAAGAGGAGAGAGR